jgi:hypothetical protein
MTEDELRQIPGKYVTFSHDLSSIFLHGHFTLEDLEAWAVALRQARQEREPRP